MILSFFLLSFFRTLQNEITVIYNLLFLNKLSMYLNNFVCVICFGIGKIFTKDFGFHERSWK